ncbi:universal stress protein [Geodermatophilus sp. SYSU D00703]
MSVPSTGQQAAGGIVVGVDGSASSEDALRWAAEQARLTGQELHAVSAWEVPMPYDGPVIGDLDLSGDTAALLEKTVGNALGAADAARVVRHVQQGHPAQVLMDVGRDADLLVVGSRGHGRLPGLLLGSVSQHVTARAACPVVVVHGHRAPTGLVVVGVDGSSESEQALRWAGRQARTTGAHLRAVIAWHVPVAYGVTAGKELDWAAHSTHILAMSVAEALGGEGAIGVEQDVVEDDPATALLDAAEGADLLVVGRRGRGGFAGMRRGSVSRHVVTHASCSVVVHPGAPEIQPARES